VDREVFPRISLRDYLSQVVISILLRFLILFVFIGAAVLMPDEFNGVALIIHVKIFHARREQFADDLGERQRAVQRSARRFENQFGIHAQGLKVFRAN
jgi:hypothetical protein